MYTYIKKKNCQYCFIGYISNKLTKKPASVLQSKAFPVFFHGHQSRLFWKCLSFNIGIMNVRNSVQISTKLDTHSPHVRVSD